MAVRVRWETSVPSIAKRRAEPGNDVGLALLFAMPPGISLYRRKQQ